MDWDDTLCPESIGALVQSLGYAPEVFWEPLDALVHEGWELAQQFLCDGRVNAIGPADYRDESPTWSILCKALDRAVVLKKL